MEDGFYIYMLQEEKTPRPNTGFLFSANNKKTEKAPDLYGSFTLEDGTTVEIVGWHKKGQFEKDYIKLAYNKHPKRI